jgi:hypothetical protein
MENIWVKTNDYYNREVVTCDVWSKKLTDKRTIYLMDSKEKNFSYTFSCGANSDYSFSGSFFGTTIDTLEKAMAYLDKFERLWFNYSSGSSKSLKELRESIKINLVDSK